MSVSTVSQNRPPPPGVPVSRKMMTRIFALDRFLIRYFNYSYMSRILCKSVGVPRMPSLLLVVKGRKSGQWLEQPLFYIRDGEKVAVIGSKGGAPEHPIWYLNLQTNPECQVVYGWRTHNVTARLSDGEERARIWANACKVFPNYEVYQQRAADRQLPVIVFDPR